MSSPIQRVQGAPRAGPCHLSPEPAPPVRLIAPAPFGDFSQFVPSDYEVIEQWDAERGRYGSQPPCEPDVGHARRRVACGMVVNENEAGGLKRVSALDELPEWDLAARNVALRQCVGR